MAPTALKVLVLAVFAVTLAAAFSPPVRSFGAQRNLVARRAIQDAPASVSSEEKLETLNFLDADTAREIAAKVGTPTYVYSEEVLTTQAKAALAFPSAYGLTTRYAMKSSPNAAILKLFHDLGLHIDASSVFEVHRALAAGVEPERISLSSQELPAAADFKDLVNKGVKVNACSLDQLERFCEALPGAEVGVRFNPGLGSGGTGKTNVGGPDSSFGIWHEWADEVAAIAAKRDNKVVRVHTHIGSGSDPAVWQRVSGMSLDLCRKFPDVTTLNLGGGYKVGRMSYEASTDLGVVGAPVTEAFEAFAEDTGRKLHLEIEPGTFLLANACSLVCGVQDVVSTGPSGREFIKLDAGMTEVLRPSLYGAQHPIIIVPKKESGKQKKYVVVGHCCESGDLLTPADGEPETIADRVLHEAAIGDLAVVEGAGAYCSSMSTKNYNSFPEAPEVMVMDATGEGALRLIRQKQPLEQIWQNEVDAEL